MKKKKMKKTTVRLAPGGSDKHDFNDGDGDLLWRLVIIECTRIWFRLDATVSATLFATNASFTYLLSWVVLHHKFMGVSETI